MVRTGRSETLGRWSNGEPRLWSRMGSNKTRRQAIQMNQRLQLGNMACPRPPSQSMRPAAWKALGVIGEGPHASNGGTTGNVSWLESRRMSHVMECVCMNETVTQVHGGRPSLADARGRRYLRLRQLHQPTIDGADATSPQCSLAGWLAGAGA